MNYVGTVKKDPYTDMNEISWGKKGYTNGAQADKDYFKQYTTPYYDNLRANGYGDIADFFKGANADTAYGYQKGYQKGAGENIYAKQYVDTNKYIEGQRKHANDVLDNSYAGQKAMTDNQINNLKVQYDDTNKRHYLNYLKSKNALPQQLSAMGYTGGLSETSALGLANEYANNVAETEAQKNAEISGLNAQLLKAYYDKEAQKAQNEAQFAQMGLNQYNTDRDWATGYEQWNKNFAEGQRQFDTTQNESKRQFDTTHGENVRQFDRQFNENVRQFDTGVNNSNLQMYLNHLYQMANLGNKEAKEKLKNFTGVNGSNVEKVGLDALDVYIESLK